MKLSYITPSLPSESNDYSLHIMHMITVEYFNLYLGLSRAEIIAQGFMFFLAGYDTLSTTLGFVFYILAINPEIQEKLYQEIEDTVENDVRRLNMPSFPSIFIVLYHYQTTFTAS